eukprot:m.3803 g.3803  ORF g.3803 m.3803 type:complete len:916 (+) comp2353_c0_seq2:127-2874(+)
MRSFAARAALAVLASLLLLQGAAALAPSAAAPGVGHNVSFDERSVIIDGQRHLIVSGALHYARILPADWPRAFALAKELGINTIQTYFMWNFHEAQRGNFTWEGRADLPAFLQLAADNDLFVALRIGPYVCGEYYFGGIPLWMRDLDDISCFRCDDAIWKREMQRVLQVVIEQVRPFLASQGGPIIMLQVENEYHGSQSYLEWAVDAARNLTAGESVPWNLCHDLGQCSQVNRDAEGNYAFRALCTINGFWMDEYDKNPAQPCPKWLADQRSQNPGQPLIWTEDQGWFDQWNVAQRIRKSDDQLYGMARFFAFGGSWHNLYMLSGGNNYGLQAGGDVVTAYAPDTVIDYLLLRHEPRFSYFSTVFKVLQAAAPELLRYPIASTLVLPSNATNATSEVTLSLQPCTDDDPSHHGVLDDSQRFKHVPAGPGQPATLESLAFPGWCIDSLKAREPPELQPCQQQLESQLWYVNNKTAPHIASVAVAPCLEPHRPGNCARCFDEMTKNQLDFWDCKVPDASNQAFSYLVKEQGIRANESGLCATVQSSHSPSRIELHRYGSLGFLSNLDEDNWLSASYQGKSYVLRNHSVQLVNLTSGFVLFDTGIATDPAAMGTSKLLSAPSARRQAQQGSQVSAPASDWKWFVEPFGGGTQRQTLLAPHEQLSLTNNTFDYLWYSTPLNGLDVGDAPPTVHATTGAGTVLYPLVNQSEPTAAQRLYILSCAMGMTNSGVSPHDGKGITGKVSVNGQDWTHRAWTHAWMLVGEAAQIFDEKHHDAVAWQAATTPAAHVAPVSWFSAFIDAPVQFAGIKATGQGKDPSQLAFALNLAGMWKGQAYVNGFHLGRYWLAPGKCSGSCAPPIKNGHCYMHWRNCDAPTQTLYHIPTSVLRPAHNYIVLFEESGNTPQRDLASVSIVALANHP